MSARFLMVGLLAWAMLGTAALGAVPGDLGAFAYRQRTGSQLPPDTVLREADGGTVRLGDIAHGAPMILALGYFHCPNLCGIVRDDLFHALSATGLRAERDYTLVSLSIDPSETSRDASTAKAQDMAAYPLPGAGAGWHFLTGSAAAVQSVADAVGFRDRFDRQTRQFLHPTGIVFATPSGVVSSYLLGVGYTPTDIRAAVARAGAGRIASAGLPILLLCFHFDPTTGRYTVAILKLLQFAGVLTVLTLGGVLFLLFRRERPRT